MALDILSFYSNTPPERDYILEGLPRGILGSIVSPGGAGKSMLALQIAHLVGGEVDTLNLTKDGAVKLKSGIVGYLSAEDNASVLHDRFHAIGSRLDDRKRQFCALSIVAEDLTTQAPDLLKEEIKDGVKVTPWLNAVNRFCAGKVLVFLDTLRSFHTGDENNGGQMAYLMNSLRAIASTHNCTIIFLHHTNKNSAFSGDGDAQQASRGSSVLVDNIRWQGYLSTMTKKEAETYNVDDDMRGYFVRFGVSKQNYGRPFDEMWFRRGLGGVLEPTKLEIRSPLAKPKSKAEAKEYEQEQIIKGRW